MTRRVPLKRVISYNDESLPDSTDDDVQINYVEISDVTDVEGIANSTAMKFGGAPSRARRIAREGDVIVSTVRTYLRAVASVGPDHDGDVVSTGFAVLHPRDVDSRFLAYAVRDEQFMDEVVARSTGISYPAIAASDLVRIPIPVPESLPKQRAIADFLDREIAQIDAFIAKSEQLITLLTERRAAVTERALAPHVGIGRRLKPYLPEVDVRAGSEWPELPLMSVSIAWGVRRRDEVTDDEPAAEDLSNYKVAEQGDIVLNRMRAFQGALGVAPERGIVSPDYAVLRPVDSVDAIWVAAVMKTSRFVGEMTQRLKGIGSTDSGAVRTPRINVADLGAILLDVPSCDAQREAVVEIGSRALKISRAIAAAERGINFARERRAALISAAVTGQLEVAA